MKKMIFMVSACAIANSLLSQNVAADTLAATSTATTSTSTATTQTESASNTGHHHKRHAKKHVNATIAATASMKDQAPKEAKTCSWLDNLSGQMALASNYVFRGVSQTQNLPAVQGGLTYQFPIGAYLNVWASNVKFPETDATIEMDTIAGWRGEIWEDLSYDLNLARYNYPGARELNYNEFNSVFNYKIFQFGYSYSADVFASHKPGRYYLIGINYDIPSKYTLNIEDISIHATTGHYTLPVQAGNSYKDYSVWISKKFRNYTLTAQWTDTNGRQHNPPYDGSQLFVILNASF